MHTSLLRVVLRSAVAGIVLVAAVTAAAPSAAAQDQSKGTGQVDWNSYQKQVGRAPHDTVASNVYQGWKQFELNCARCHGEYAVGTSFAPALVQSLKDGGPVPTKEAFIQTVCAGRPDRGMPSWCQLGLEMAKIENIYAYVKGRADGKIRVGRPAVKPEG